MLDLLRPERTSHWISRMILWAGKYQYMGYTVVTKFTLYIEIEYLAVWPRRVAAVSLWTESEILGLASRTCK